MPKPSAVTKDGRCPYCNADFSDEGVDGTWLFWEAQSWGRGYVARDSETGELFYSGTSSETSSSVTGFECGNCGQKLRLRKGTEEAWS
jgi:hypothetical protein